MSFKSGYISIIGRPNAGKSTLLNTILKEKIMIVSPKAQTTRNNVQGILSKEDVQYVFIDTPGIHKPHHELGKTLNKNAYSAIQDVDIIYMIIDGNEAFGSGDEFLLDRLKNVDAKIFLVINKVDLFNKEKLIKIINVWKDKYNFDEIIPISARDDINIDTLLDVTKDYLNEGPKYFPDDMKSDHGKNFLLGEIIREKVLYKTEEEVPHSVAVVVEKCEEKGKDLYLDALIIVERDSQKGIIIGKQGSMIKNIGIEARKELQYITKKHIFLNLYVKVEKDWRNKPAKLKQYGYSEFDYNE